MTPDTVHIRHYGPQDAAAFRDLNLAWIERYFKVEDTDRYQLENPDETIIAKGGRILVAEVDGRTIGVVALIKHKTDNMWELAKMAVDPSAAGRGIGQALMNAALQAARDMGAESLWLETNTRLKSAMHIYIKTGFKQLPPDDMVPTPYDRCNCQMRLALNSNS